MDKFNKLVVITEQESPHSLVLLAQSVGLQVEQKSRIALMAGAEQKAGTLFACPYLSSDLNKKGLSIELQYLQKKAPCFLFQAERSMVDIKMAVYSGIRGVVFRDEQLDRVLTALKTMMNGQLYYSRPVMSELLDELLKPKLALMHKSTTLSDSNLLTRQEKRIIQLVAEGARNKEIAEQLNISAHTVKAHLSAIFRKTQARNRVELLRSQQGAARYDSPVSFKAF